MAVLGTIPCQPSNAVDREFKEIQSAEYLIAHHTLPAFHDGLRRVLEKMERLGVKPGLKPH